MKRYTNNTSIITVSRKYGWLPLVAFAAMLAGCTADNITDDTNPAHTPVTFNATVSGAALPQAAATRTTASGDEWVQGDEVGVFMLTTGGQLPAGISSGADNIRHKATPANPASGATFAPADAGETIYYPQSGAVDFIAYYPYGSKGTDDGEVTDAYIYNVSVADQADPAAIDVLYARETGVARSKAPVALAFGHVMSKITLHVSAGNGLTASDISGLAASDVMFGGMPVSAELSLQDGTLTAGDDLTQTFHPRKAATPQGGGQATFTALLVPQPTANGYTGRTVVFTLGGQDYTWTIPDADVFASNVHYTYPLTVQKTGIVVAGNPAITDWTTNDHGTGTAEIIHTVTFDANGATGTPPAPQEAGSGTDTELPDGTGLTPPTGKIFLGWSTTADYSGDFHRPGARFTPTANATLYAVWSGDGASDANPTYIFDAEGLAAMADGLDKAYRLMKDITVEGWIPVGADGSPFTGRFDGQGHTVTINSIYSKFDNSTYVGLFGAGNACRIRQVCVAGSLTYRGSVLEAAGGIIGHAGSGSIIENCLVTADLSMGINDVTLGGISGKGESNTIVRNCLVRGNLSGNSDWGGIGGIVGRGDVQIGNCVILSASITGNFGYNGSIFRICNTRSTFWNNYGNQNMSGKPWTSDGQGVDGADCAPKLAIDWWMAKDRWKTDAGFTAWDFTHIWEMGPDGYPRLRPVQR